MLRLAKIEREIALGGARVAANPLVWEQVTMPVAVEESQRLSLRMLFRTGGDPKIEDYATGHGATPHIRIEEYRDGRVLAYRRRADDA